MAAVDFICSRILVLLSTKETNLRPIFESHTDPTERVEGAKMALNHMADKFSELQHREYQSHQLEDFPPCDSEEYESADEMEGFFQTIGDLWRSINEISLRVDNMGHNYMVMLTISNQGARDENTRLVNEVNSLSKSVHAGLKRLKAEVEEDESGPERNTADVRIKKAQFTTLSLRFRDVLENYNSIQEDYLDKRRERIHRTLAILGRTVTEEEMEEMLESDNPNIFSQDILVNTAQKRQALNEVEAHHREFLQLEENTRELHEMFYYMALLDEEQGELIDQIEYNVETAAIHVVRVRRELRTAVVFQRRNRRLKLFLCLCCCCCCV